MIGDTASIDCDVPGCLVAPRFPCCLVLRFYTCSAAKGIPSTRVTGKVGSFESLAILVLVCSWFLLESPVPANRKGRPNFLMSYWAKTRKLFCTGAHVKLPGRVEIAEMAVGLETMQIPPDTALMNFSHLLVLPLLARIVLAPRIVQIKLRYVCR